MSLSSELISQFAKVTNDKATPKKDSTVYGTIKEIDGVNYLHIDGAYHEDGSPIYMPLTSTVSTQKENRVIVSIRNHMAVVTGNLSTPSTTEAHVTQVGTTITGQFTDSIRTLVTDSNGASLMTQTENGWTFSTAEIQNTVNKTVSDLSDLVNQCGDTNAAVEVLQHAVSDLGKTAEYVRIGVHDGEPCIELGESDSNFKLLITNTRIMFMDGSDIPAYINNKSLNIKKAVIEEELHHGSWVWKARNNGNLGLAWKGVTN